jgi:hypothetical protein
MPRTINLKATNNIPPGFHYYGICGNCSTPIRTVLFKPDIHVALSGYSHDPGWRERLYNAVSTKRTTSIKGRITPKEITSAKFLEMITRYAKIAERKREPRNEPRINGLVLSPYLANASLMFNLTKDIGYGQRPVLEFFTNRGVNMTSYIVSRRQNGKTYTKPLLAHGKNIMIIDTVCLLNHLSRDTSCFDTPYFVWLLYKNLVKPDIAMRTVKPPPIMVKLGADPEFEFLSVDRSDKKEKSADYKEKAIGANTILKGGCGAEVGTDGCSSIAEIRPKPGDTPSEVTKNIERCMEKLRNNIEQKNQNVFVNSGGGFHYSIGGHIHLGNDTLKQLARSGALKELGYMLDDFVYVPIKTQMPGAVRQWSSLDGIGKEKIYDLEEGRERTVWHVDQVKDKIKAKKVDQYCKISSYDHASAFREKPYGVEYRSLPSFLCDKTFTELVFTLIQNIAKKYLEIRQTGEKLRYNLPPTRADYLTFLTPNQYDTFLDYLKGPKRDAFLKDTLANWNLPIDLMSIVIEFSGQHIPMKNDDESISSLKRNITKTLGKELESLMDSIDPKSSRLIIGVYHTFDTIYYGQNDALEGSYIFATKNSVYAPCEITEKETLCGGCVPLRDRGKCYDVFIGIPPGTKFSTAELAHVLKFAIGYLAKESMPQKAYEKFQGQLSKLESKKPSGFVTSKLKIFNLKKKVKSSAGTVNRARVNSSNMDWAVIPPREVF